MQPDSARAPAPRVLVVEDDENLCRLISRVLEAYGYEVASLTDPQRVLAHLSRHRVDLVLTDLVMPKLQGTDLIRQIRAGMPDLPVVVISGSGDDDSLDDAMAAGADDYVTKPIKGTDLDERLKAILGGG